MYAQFLFFKDYIYLFLEKGEGREKERERDNVQLPLECPQLARTWPTTQACALLGNRTSDPLVLRTVLKPLSHTSQGSQFLISIIEIYKLNNYRKPNYFTYLILNRSNHPTRMIQNHYCSFLRLFPNLPKELPNRTFSVLLSTF